MNIHDEIEIKDEKRNVVVKTEIPTENLHKTNLNLRPQYAEPRAEVTSLYYDLILIILYPLISSKLCTLPRMNTYY